MTSSRLSVRNTAFLLPAGAFGVISPIGIGGSYGIDGILESRRVVDVDGDQDQGERHAVLVGNDVPLESGPVPH